MTKRKERKSARLSSLSTVPRGSSTDDHPPSTTRKSMMLSKKAEDRPTKRYMVTTRHQLTPLMALTIQQQQQPERMSPSQKQTPRPK